MSDEVEASVTRGRTADELQAWLRPYADGTILDYRVSIAGSRIVVHHPYYTDKWRAFEVYDADN